MRISVNPKDRDYVGTENLCRFRVFLDDVEQKMCLSADDTAGVVVRVATNQDGSIAMNEERTKIIMEEVAGKVRIDLLPPADEAAS